MVLLCANCSAACLQNHFIGIDGELLKNVEARIKTVQTSHSKRLDRARIEQYYHEAPHEIKQAIAPFGYLKPTIHSHLHYRQGCWQACYKIELGQPLRITKLNIKILGAGRYDPKFQKLLRDFPIKQGQQFNAEQYENARTALFDLSLQRGYFDAKMHFSQVTIDKKKNTAHIAMTFDTGPRFHFGYVSFSKTPLSDIFLKRYLLFKPGQPYTSRLIQKLQNDLGNSHYFDSVLVNPDIKQAHALHVPIQVHLKTRPARRYMIGGGFGTDTGPRGLLGIELRHINPYGHYFTGYLKASPRHSNLQANYVIPGYHPATSRHQFSAMAEELDLDSGESISQSAAASYITRFHGWEQTLVLTWLNERYSFRGTKTRNSSLLMPNASWTKVKKNHDSKPTRGYRIAAQVRGSSNQVMSSTSFAQASVHAKYLRPITRNQRLILRGALGRTFIDKLSALPFSLQLAAGGARSVRGFGYRAITFGRNMFVASIEVQQRIYGNFYLAGFVDTGNVANNLSSDIRRAAGTGIVWLSPVGALELTVARPLDRDLNRWMLQFTMGPEL